jgi:hypothetical protein
MAKDISDPVAGLRNRAPAAAREIADVLSADVRTRAVREFVQHQPEIPVLTEEREISIAALKPRLKRFHGTKVPLAYFPFPAVASPCADKFGYMSPAKVRTATALPFSVANQILLGKLGDFMGTQGTAGADSIIPAGFTYFGQFVDHDVTFDTSSSLDAPTDATKVNNMRSPALDLDSFYGKGPALDAFLYRFPSAGPPSAIKLVLGSNRANGPGGPGGLAGRAGMKVQTTFDVPRVINPLDPDPANPTLSTNTAIIGDPRNDENLIVSQFHHTMIKFHNEVVDTLVSAGFAGDIFTEAKKIVTHHYQWTVVKDFLERVCGTAAVNAALALPVAIGSAFSMPVEFAVAAYRFGHSMIRETYWVSAAEPGASLSDVFKFIRNPEIPVRSNWVVDFNAFFQTGIPVAVFNQAKKIDSVLAPGLNTLPGFPPGAMAALATRNLRRGLALGLPSGQGMAGFFGVPAMTAAQLTSGLPPAEVALLNSNSQLLLKQTPLWYYCLREAAVLHAGNQLGPVGGRIVAETFMRMLKRDPNSYLNAPGGFTPFLPTLPSTPPGQFTVADLATFAKVTVP